MQIRNTELVLRFHSNSRVSSTLYDQVKSVTCLILPDPKFTQDSAKWWNFKYEFLKYETLNTDKFSSSRKYTNFVTEKGKPRCLPFILNPPVCLADYQNMSQTSKKKGLCFEGPHSKCCSNRANPGARGGKKNPSMTTLETEFPYIFKRNRCYFRSVSLSQKNVFFSKSYFPWH